MLTVEPCVILEYIRNSFEILMNLKMEESGGPDSLFRNRERQTNRSSRTNDSVCQNLEEYEQMVQKLEADVRQHIRVEQQLKLHIENMQEKAEEDAKYIDKLGQEVDRNKRERKRMDEMLTIREKEIEQLDQKARKLEGEVKRWEAKFRVK